MSAARRDDEMLSEILDLVRRYALARYGQLPRIVRLELWDGRHLDEVVPSVPLPTTGAGGAAFSRKQALVVEALRRAGGADVDEAELLKAADSDSPRLRDLFKRHPAWGTLIVPGDEPRTFRLAEEEE